MGNFTIKKGSNGQYYFNLKASNGEIILQSEGYLTKLNCQNGISSVRINSQVNSHYVKKIAINGEYYFNLIASNGQVIGVSETYLSIQGREKGVESVKINAPNAVVSDLTWISV